MDSLKRDNVLLNLSFAFFLIDIVLFSWWGANSNIEYVLPTFCLSFLTILPLCFLRKQGFYNNFERIIFFSGAYLVIYALIGYFNPSKEFLKYVDYTYLKELPFIEYLPTSVKSPIIYNNALTSAMKIASVFFVVLFAIKAFRRRYYVNFTLNFLAVNGTLVAIFGIVQKKMHFAMLYNTFLATSDFYATFFLSSTAGVFINLTLGINLALFYYNAKHKQFFRAIAFLVMAGLCVYSSKLSLSNGALLLSYTTCACFVVISIFVALNRVARARYAFLISFTYLFITGFIFLSTMKTSRTQDLVESSATGRLSIYKNALAVVENYPYFGVGGECSRYILPAQSYIIKEQESKKPSAVPARAHMDILEYFIEFGLLGAWVIVLSFFAYIFKFFSKIQYLSAENAMLFTAVMLCVTHSMWDLVLHFQSAMIYMGIVAILSLNKIGRSR